MSIQMNFSKLNSKKPEMLTKAGVVAQEVENLPSRPKALDSIPNPVGRKAGRERGRGKVVEKGSRRVNMVQKMGTHVCKCKNDTC
jgi:hypothetical protein